MRQTTWTPVYFIAQLFYFIALVRRALVRIPLSALAWDFTHLQLKMKNALRDTQTLRAGCSKAELKKIRPAADSGRRGGAGRPKFNQLEMVTTFIYKPSLVKIDARNFELS